MTLIINRQSYGQEIAIIQTDLHTDGEQFGLN